MLKEEIINSLMTIGLSNDLEQSRIAIQDIELLIERHVKNNYLNIEEYSLIMSKGIVNITLSDNDVQIFVYFLFYVLFNSPDKAWTAAKALGKCYGQYNIIEGLCQAIEVYKNKNDYVTRFLIKSITDSASIDELNQRALSVFKDIIKNGPVLSKEFLYDRYKYELQNELFR